MKLTLLSIALLISTLGSTAGAQTSIKLFDAVPITWSNSSMPWEYSSSVTYRTKEVYLNCPVDGLAEGTLTGPNGGNLIVDNFLAVNGVNVCPINCFGGVSTSPFDMIGQPVDGVYNGISPLDVSARLNGSGVYRFDLMDFGDVFASGEVYLTTNCGLETSTQICHRNFGRTGGKTLTVGESAVAAHLAHGDTAGPCTNGN